MENKRKIYAGSIYFQLGAGDSGFQELTIPAPRRNIRLVSLMYQINIVDILSGNVIPWRTSVDPILLTINRDPLNRKIISNLFQIGASLNGGLFNSGHGVNLLIYEPGQYMFDEFYAANELTFLVSAANQAGNDKAYSITLIVKTEEIVQSF